MHKAREDHPADGFVERRAPGPEQIATRLADSAMALLGCRTRDDVYDAIGDFMLLVCPDGVVIINDTSPDLESLTTVRAFGVDDLLLSRASEIVGFNPIGKKLAIDPSHRDLFVSGTLSTIPGGFAGLAAIVMPGRIADATAKVVGLHDALSIGIADGTRVLGNIQIYTRTAGQTLPVSAIESFAQHCFSALDGLQRQAALEESRRLLESSLESQKDTLLFSIDQEYRYLYFNGAHAAAMRYAYGREPAIGLDILELISDEEDRVAAKANYDRALAGESHSNVRVFGDANKSYFESFFNPMRTGSGEVIGATGMARDITERMLGVEELRRTTAYLENLLDYANDPIVVWDPDRRITRFNRAFEQLTGIESEEAIGRQVGELLSEETAATWEAVEIPIRSKDGQDRAVIWNSANVYGPDGETLVATIAQGHDITELRYAQNALLEEQEQSLRRLTRSLDAIVDIVGQVAETRDPYTAGHQDRVAQLAVRIAEELGMSAEAIDTVRIAALLHDIGKLIVPAEILSRPGRLSAIEFELVRAHCETGSRIIGSTDIGGDIAEIVLQHHERCDGSGYPRGLDADGLLAASKVIMVADVAEAMLSHRPYRPALGTETALEEIESGAGSRYDGDVARACVRVFREGGFAFAVR